MYIYIRYIPSSLGALLFFCCDNVTPTFVTVALPGTHPCYLISWLSVQVVFCLTSHLTLNGAAAQYSLTVEDGLINGFRSRRRRRVSLVLAGRYSIGMCFSCNS